MTSAVVVFPGSNRERDMIAALTKVSGAPPHVVWYAESELPAVDLVVLPGGFSYGDYLRAGAIAARAPIMPAVARHAARGGLVLGICNGFQILTEAGMLPGALRRNAGLTFVCRKVALEVVRDDTPFTRRYTAGDIIACPVAHHDGNYVADADTLARLEGERRIVFRYASGTNPNGSAHDIAGIVNEAGNVLGMMPHPENLIEPLQGGADGRRLFESACDAVHTV